MGRRPEPGAAGWRAARQRPAEHASAAHLDDAHVVRGSAASLSATKPPASLATTSEPTAAFAVAAAITAAMAVWSVLLKLRLTEPRSPRSDQ